MSYHTHTLFGIITAVGIIKILTALNITDLSFLINGSLFNPNLAEFYLASVLGALIPDIDHVNSRTARKLWFISKPLKLFGIKHRGVTHSLLGLIFFTLLTKQLVSLGWIKTIFWWGLIIGYLSHIIADMFNVQGIPLFYPNTRRFKFHLNITTNSWKEHLLFFLIFTSLFIFLLKERGIINFNFQNLPDPFKLN